MSPIGLEIRNFIRPGHIPTAKLKARYENIQTSLDSKYKGVLTQLNTKYKKKEIKLEAYEKIKAQAQFLIDKLETNLPHGTKTAAKKMLRMIFKGLEEGPSRRAKAIINKIYPEGEIKKFEEASVHTQLLLKRINDKIDKLFKKDIDLKAPHSLDRTSSLPTSGSTLSSSASALFEGSTPRSSNSTIDLNGSPNTDLSFHLPDSVTPTPPNSPTSSQHSATSDEGSIDGNALLTKARALDPESKPLTEDLNGPTDPDTLRRELSELVERPTYSSNGKPTALPYFGVRNFRLPATSKLIPTRPTRPTRPRRLTAEDIPQHTPIAAIPHLSDEMQIISPLKKMETIHEEASPVPTKPTFADDCIGLVAGTVNLVATPVVQLVKLGKFFGL